MTKQEAINELTRAAELCPTTPLAEACRYAVNWMENPCKYCVSDDSWMPGERKGGEKPDCGNCRHADRMPRVYPCSQCEQRYSEAPSRWEPKEV